MKKKVSLIGGSGFLGINIAKELYRRGFDIIIYDLNKPKKLNIKYKFEKGNVLNLKNLIKKTKGSNYLINLSGVADISYSSNNYIETINSNVMGTLNTLETCKINKIRNYLFSSSVYVYSNSGSFYKSSKQAAECIIQEYCKNFKINFKILRYGSLYGEGSQDWNGIKKYLIESLKYKKILYSGSGKEIRQMIHIVDACKLSVDIMQNSKFNNKSITITGNKSITSKEILSKIFKTSGLTEKIIFKNLKNSLHYSKSPYTYKPIKEIIIKPKKDMNFELGLKNILKEIT